MIDSLLMLIPGLLFLFWLFLPIIRVIHPTFLRPKRHCLECGHEGPIRSKMNGSFLVEIILYMLFLLPGLLYAMSRSKTKRDVCNNCGSERIIPLNSPKLKTLESA